MNMNKFLEKLGKEKPELRQHIRPLLKVTASDIGWHDDPQWEEAFVKFAKDAELPPEFKAKEAAAGKKTSFKIPVPKGMESLFSTVSVVVNYWPNGSAGIEWAYTHPGGGSNGKDIGSVASNRNGEIGYILVATNNWVMTGQV